MVDSMSASAPVFLWCHPRSLSTAFERAFLQREDDFLCYHEPFGDPFYFGEDALSSRFKSSTCAINPTAAAAPPPPTYMQVLHEVLHYHDGRPSVKRVFVKDMAQYVVLPPHQSPIEEDNPTTLPMHTLMRMKHTFLVRDPHHSVPSYWRMCVGKACAETGFLFYDPEEAGYSEMRVLFDYIGRLTGETPLLITAEDLVDDADKMMRLYCSHVGVEFRDSMLNWEAKRIPAFDKWKGFHRDAQESTGFGKLLHPKLVHPETLDEYQLPRVVCNTIQHNMPHYNYLSKFKIS